MDAMLIVDMQVGLLNGEPKHDLPGVIERINRLAAKVPADVVVQKNLNDPFAGADLQARLNRIAPDRVLITGWATDLCVDATVRSAVANHHNVVVVTDAHTLSDRPHLDAVSVIRHHHWVWSHLITQKSVRLALADELLR